MYIKDFDFTKIKTMRKQCIDYGENGNDVVIVPKDLYPIEKVMNCLALKGFYIETCKNDGGYVEYEVWSDLGNYCIQFHRLDRYNVLPHEFDIERDLDCMLEVVTKYKGKRGFKKLIEDEIAEAGWLPKTYTYGLKILA